MKSAKKNFGKKRMGKIDYDWLPKDYEIHDNEDFVFVKYRGIPQSVYPHSITEETLKKEIKNLEKRLKNEK